MIPKVTPFLRTVDPETHLKAFQAQMMISRGSNVVRCQMFGGSLTGNAFKWFTELPENSITSFAVFVDMFMAKYIANKVRPLG